MHFDNPQALYLLFFWLVLVWLAVRAGRWRLDVALKIGQPELLERLYPLSIRQWRRRRSLLILIAALLLIIAAARPQYGQLEQTVRSAGTNVLIALDCSRSMEAQDVMPNRITRAKQALNTLLRRLGGDRVGIIAFAGNAFLQCPMTLDHAMAELVLKSMDTNSVGVPGTDLASAINVATAAFDRGAGEGGRALVLLTDGEDNEGKGAAAAKAAAAKGVKIYSIGFGTTRGAPLLEEKGGFKEDASGGKVNTRLDLQSLNAISDATGGRVYEAGSSPERAIEAVLHDLSLQQKSDLEARRLVIRQERFQWFLVPALALLLWAMLLRPAPTQLSRPELNSAP
jgi:Ca-activated chloride channel family protein